jgi:hypothetical protein
MIELSNRRYPKWKMKRESWHRYLFRFFFPKQYWALTWYADDHSYQAIHAKEQMALIMVDHGDKAREALEE